MQKWFACWHVADNWAHTLDAYPDEIEPYRRDMTRRRECFSGPYDTHQEALLVAMNSCLAARRARPRRRRKHMTVIFNGELIDQKIVHEWLKQNGRC